MEEKKKKNRTSAKAVLRYEQKSYDKLLLRVYKGDRELIKARADELGKSINQYLYDLLRADIEELQAKK